VVPSSSLFFSLLFFFHFPDCEHHLTLPSMREEDAGEDPVAAAAEEKLHAIQRGFLTTVRSPPAVAGDVGEFLDTTARKVMEQASELMAKEGPEATPFKYKYEARELLVGHPFTCY